MSGILITVTGHFVSLTVGGAALSTIGAGLISTLDIGSSSGQWIGYQALIGIGSGMAIQVPMIVNQAVVEMSDISTVSSMTLFFQTIGGAFFVSAGETAFANTLLAKIPITAPNVSPAAVLAAGATQLRSTFAAEDIPGILRAYMDGLHVTFYLAIALAGMSVVIACLTEWRNVKGKVEAGGSGV